LAGATATGLLAVLVSPVSWPHHLVWLVPAVGVLTGWWWRDRKRWVALVGGLTVWLLLAVRSHRLGQLLVDTYPAGVLRVTGDVLRDSFMLTCAAVVVVLGCTPARSPASMDDGSAGTLETPETADTPEAPEAPVLDRA
ncbi:MAG TPA: hypothetical protein VL179_12675, partial [Mycobacterium sp.]|nr:hypothetical protein [Mycobacterium sp.]